MVTNAQLRMLDEVVKAGTKRYNGRATRTIERLLALGLVRADYDLVPHAVTPWTEEWTVIATAYGERMLHQWKLKLEAEGKSIPKLETRKERRVRRAFTYTADNRLKISDDPATHSRG